MRHRQFIVDGKATKWKCTPGNRVELTLSGGGAVIAGRLISQSSDKIRVFAGSAEREIELAVVRHAVEFDAAAWEAKSGHRDGAKTERVNLRVTPADRMVLERAAIETGESLSEYVTRMAVEATRAAR